jgi:hypothetical protein
MERHSIGASSDPASWEMLVRCRRSDCACPGRLSGCMKRRHSMGERSGLQQVRQYSPIQTVPGRLVLRHNETFCTGAHETGREQTELLWIEAGTKQTGPKQPEAHSPLSGPRYRGSNPCLQPSFARLRRASAGQASLPSSEGGQTPFDNPHTRTSHAAESPRRRGTQGSSRCRS